MTNQHRRQRAAVDLLNIWTGDVYNEDFADPQDCGYVPLAWTMDPVGHLEGELLAAHLTLDDAVDQLGVWADYLGIDLEQAEDGTVRGTLPYTPDGPTGVTVNVSLLFRRREVPLPIAGSATVRALMALGELK